MIRPHPRDPRFPVDRKPESEELKGEAETQGGEPAAEADADVEGMKKRQNSKRPRGVKERILETKHRRSAVKKQRTKDW
jgi:hypothetical protein